MADSTDPNVEVWSKDWRRLRTQKHRARGGHEAAMLLDFLLYEGEHQSVQVQNTILTRAFSHAKDKNKLRLVIPIARKLADRKIGRHSSIAHSFYATPNTDDPLAYDLADVVGGKLIPALDHKLQQDTMVWKLYMWLVTCGVCFEHVDWKEGVSMDVMPKYNEQGEMMWRDQLSGQEIPQSQADLIMQAGYMMPEQLQPAVEATPIGDVGNDLYDPFRVFVDAGVGSIRNLGPDQAVYLADLRTDEWIAETFGSDVAAKLQPSKDLSILATSLLDRGIPVSGLNLKDLLPMVSGSRDKDDPPTHIVLTRYQPPHKANPQGLRSFFVPDQCVLDAGVIPYPEVPVIDYHWAAPAATIWTPGFMRWLQSLSKFVNKRFSQMGEAANAQIYEMMLLGGDLTAKDIPTDFPGAVENGLGENGEPLVKVVQRGQLPAFFPESIRLSMETLDGLGSSDLLSQRKFPGQLRGPLALPILQEMLDSEDGPKYKHLAGQFALEKEMRINRVKQFYPPIRTLNYTGQNLRGEVLELHADELLRAGIDFTITFDPGSIFPEVSSMREARVRERLQWAPGLYTNARTGQLDWSKVADDLKFNDRQRESKESLGRQVTRQLIQRMRQGKLTTIEVEGQPGPDGLPQKKLQLVTAETNAPYIAYPWMPHNIMLDELESSMQTLEWMDASPQLRRSFLTLHEAHRNVLLQIQQAQQSSIENRMVQGAVAQATQQAAAKAAAQTVESVMMQMDAQQEAMPSGGGELEGRIRELMGQMQGEQEPNSPLRSVGPQLAQRRSLSRP